MRVTRLGHATLLVESDRARVLVDPGAFSDGWHDVDDVDAILVTHQHRDHLDPNPLAGLIDANPRVRLYAEPEAAALVADHSPRPVAPGDIITIADLGVGVVGGSHALIHERLPQVGNVGYVLSVGDGARLFHPGDSYATAPPGVDVLALPLCAPWANVAATVAFAEQVSAPRLFPIHDAIVSDTGRALFMKVVAGLCPETMRLEDPPPGAGFEV